VNPWDAACAYNARRHADLRWEAVGWRGGFLCADGLAEGDPEAVAIANNEFAHSVKGLVQVFDYVGFSIEPLAGCIDVIDIDVEVEFAPWGITRIAACTQHNGAFA
jgi:hypothetical protein